MLQKYYNGLITVSAGKMHSSANYYKFEKKIKIHRYKKFLINIFQEYKKKKKFLQFKNISVFKHYIQVIFLNRLNDFS